MAAAADAADAEGLPLGAACSLPLAFAGVGGKCLIPWRAPPCVCRGRRISTISPLYIPTVYPLYPHYIPTISPLCPHYIPTISPLYPHYIPTISPLYPQWLLKPPLEVTVLDDKEVRRRFRASNYQSTTRRSNGDGIYLVESDFPFLRQ